MTGEEMDDPTHATPILPHDIPGPATSPPLRETAMARIARRSLRIRGLPLFSLGHPWSSVVTLGHETMELSRKDGEEWLNNGY